MLSTEDLEVETLTADDAAWDEARMAWNLSVDQQPEAVVFPTSAEDIARVVGAARQRGLRVAAQATGHGATPMGPLDGTVLLKTSRMRGVTVDADARVARAEAGAQWMDLAPLAAEHGLAGLAGSAQDVGVVGYTLGGGTGWLSRKHGLASNSVVAVELVLADGSQVRVDASSDPDLFWAVRGGGGGFGIVTAIELGLVEAPSLYGGVFFWPWERSSEVLHAWREWTDGVPEEMTSLGRIVQYPPLPMLPEAIRGKQFVLVEAAFLGDEAAGAQLLAPLRALDPVMDTFATIPPTLLHTLHNDPPQPVPGRGNGLLLDALPAEAVDAFVGVAGPGSGSPFIGAEIRHFGGALAVAPEGAGAQPTIPGPFGTFCVGMAATPEMGAGVEAHLDRTAETLAPWCADRAFMNLADRPTTPEVLFGTEAAARLREIKGRVDPDDTIRANHAL